MKVRLIMILLAEFVAMIAEGLLIEDPWLFCGSSYLSWGIMTALGVKKNA